MRFKRYAYKIDVKNLSSNKLGCMLRSFCNENAHYEVELLTKVRLELIDRGHYHSELTRSMPH